MLFTLKEDVVLGDVQKLEPAIMPILSFVILYCHRYQLPCKITSLISDRDKVHAMSTTHEEGRAFDLSIQGIPEFHIKRIVFHACDKFKAIAAISKETGMLAAAVSKPHGTGPHIHFQVRPLAPYEQFLGLD